MVWEQKPLEQSYKKMKAKKQLYQNNVYRNFYYKKKVVYRNVSTFSYMHENDVFIKKHENENFKLKRKT